MQIPHVIFNKCIWCWACEHVAKSVFKMDYDTWISKVIKADTYSESEIKMAMSVCPTNAIEVEDK